MDFGSVFSGGGGGIMSMSLGHNLRVEDEARQRSHDQQDFQAKMSNSAHVREVADLKAAGLNPILSAGGSGASSPGGASMMPSESDPVAGAVSAMRANTERDAADANIDQAKTQAGLNSANAAKQAEEAKQLKWLNEFYQTPSGRKALIYRDQKTTFGGLGAVGTSIVDPVVNSAKSAGKAVNDYIYSPGKTFQIDKKSDDAFKRTHPLRR